MQTTILVAAVPTPVTSPALADPDLMGPDRRLQVHVHCAPAAEVRGLPLRVLRVDRLREGLVPVNDHPPVIDADGTGTVAVDPGDYVLEVLGAQADGIVVSVHSPIVAISRDQTVEIPMASPQALTFFNGDESMLIEQVAVRSAAVCDDAGWHRHAPGDVPRVVLSPGQVGAANVVASRGSLHVAAWVDVGEGVSPQLRVKQDWNRIRFGWRDGTPPLKAATARIEFPVGDMAFPIEPQTQLITNRKFLTVGYGVTLETGQSLPFRPVGRAVTANDRLYFGGKLTPRAWAGFIWPEDGGNAEKQLQWRVDLVDDGGQTADIYSSSNGITCALRKVDGTPVHDGPYTLDDARFLGDLSKTLRADLKWSWDQPYFRTLPVANFQEVRSEHFRLPAVPAWSWETRNYLTKLERYFRVEQKATGRPGPQSIGVEWRDHTWNAKSRVGNPNGGGEWLWLSVPFRTYEDNHNPYYEPHFVGHEMLHTFGYNHGDVMTNMQREVEHMFADYQWYMQDHPSETITVLPAMATPAQ